MFVALEGIDGVGKTTSCNMLKEILEVNGQIYHVIHDPNKNEPIGNFVMKSRINSEDFIPPIWAMLYACSSINLQVGLNGYKYSMLNNHNIILDRTVLSSYAYYHGKFSFDWLDEIHNCYQHPDITIILDLNPEVILDRLKKRNTDKIIPNINHIESLKAAYYDSCSHLIKKGVNIQYLNISENDTIQGVANNIISLINKHYSK